MGSTAPFVPVQESTEATDWAQVSAGTGHTCAVKTDGRLFCWGVEGEGKLGRKPQAGLAPAQEFTAATDWADVSTGWLHSCAVKTDGRLFCWGNGSDGQLGNGSTMPSLVPAQEWSEAMDWVQVSAGNEHTCALKKDGRLFCWGRGSELGHNSYESRSLPVQESTAATDWAQVSTMGSHTCALKTDGRLYCWGQGYYGQLGRNSTTNSLVPVQELTEATDWVQVSGGGAHTCALKTDGRLYCWGAGGEGRLGHGSTTNSLVPVQEATEATDWVQVSCGSYHTCAVKVDGRLYCWGHGDDGELGHGSATDSLVPVQEATEATDWARVSAGTHHTCAVKKDGRLYCWGEGRQLGTDSTERRLVPTPEGTTATNWWLVAAGSYVTCSLKTDGRLFCWGPFSSNHGTGTNIAPVWPTDWTEDPDLPPYVIERRGFPF